MSRFVTENDVREIRASWWDEGESVTIRRYTIAQRDAMHAEILKIAGRVGGLTEIEVKAAQVPILLAGIRSWTFKELDEADAKTAPVNRHWIGQMSGEDADFIADAIRKLNPGRTAEEQEKF